MTRTETAVSYVFAGFLSLVVTYTVIAFIVHLSTTL